MVANNLQPSNNRRPWRIQWNIQSIIVATSVVAVLFAFGWDWYIRVIQLVAFALVVHWIHQSWDLANTIRSDSSASPERQYLVSEIVWRALLSAILAALLAVEIMIAHELIEPQFQRFAVNGLVLRYRCVLLLLVIGVANHPAIGVGNVKSRVLGRVLSPVVYAAAGLICAAMVTQALFAHIFVFVALFGVDAALISPAESPLNAPVFSAYEPTVLRMTANSSAVAVIVALINFSLLVRLARKKSTIAWWLLGFGLTVATCYVIWIYARVFPRLYVSYSKFGSDPTTANTWASAAALVVVLTGAITFRILQKSAASEDRSDPTVLWPSKPKKYFFESCVPMVALMIALLGVHFDFIRHAFSTFFWDLRGVTTEAILENVLIGQIIYIGWQYRRDGIRERSRIASSVRIVDFLSFFPAVLLAFLTGLVAIGFLCFAVMLIW